MDRIFHSSAYLYRFFPVETSLFSSSQNSHRFEPPIRQFSSRSDLLYVPTLGTFLSYERSLLRSFGSPQLRRTWSKKRQNFPVEKSNFSSRKVKLFQWKSQTFPVEKANFSSGKVKLFRRGEHAFSRGKWKLAHRFRSRVVV